MNPDPAGAPDEPVDGTQPEATDEHADEAEQGDKPAGDPVTDTGVKSERELEKAFKDLAKEGERHAAAVSRIMGEDALELIPCPMCWEGAAGFRFPGELEGPQLEAVLDAIGLGEAQEYAKAIDARPCEDCNALGRVLTGSLVADHKTKLCASCKGTGYVIVQGRPSGNGAGAELVAPSVVPELPAEQPADVDPWGRSSSDPNFGRLPQFVRA